MTRAIQIFRSALTRQSFSQAPVPYNAKPRDVQLTREELAQLFARELGYSTRA